MKIRFLIFLTFFNKFQINLFTSNSTLTDIKKIEIMRKIIIMSVLVLTSFIYKAADAQVNISINFGMQPDWGPVGYQQARYYYLPDIDVYYHIQDKNYTWLEGKKWVTRKNLPNRYRNINLYNSYKVVLNDNNPWNKHYYNKKNYAYNKGRKDQINIRDQKQNNIKYIASNSNNKQNNTFSNRASVKSSNDFESKRASVAKEKNKKK